MTFGRVLEKLRTEAGLSCPQLARKSGVNVVSLYSYERDSTTPTLSSIQLLAKALGVGLAVFEGCTTPNKGKQYKSKR